MLPSAAVALAPLDALRRRVFRAFRPWSGTLAGDRDLRVMTLGTASVAVSLALTCAAPLWLLALGPVVLGVPHLLADVRYLVVRPGLHRRDSLVAWSAFPLGVAALAAAIPHAIGVGAGGLAVAAMLVARGSALRRATGIFLGIGLIALTLRFDPWTTLVLAHLHNVVGVAMWWAWRPRRAGHAGVLAMVVAGTALLLSGAVDGVLGSARFPGIPDAASHLARLAPGVPAAWATRLVLVFAFLQSVHYGVWLRLVPDDDRPRPTPRSFAASWRALRADFGAFSLAACVVVALGLAAWAARDVAAANLGYLRLAAFHGPLEFGVAALWWAEGRRA